MAHVPTDAQVLRALDSGALKDVIPSRPSLPVLKDLRGMTAYEVGHMLGKQGFEAFNDVPRPEQRYIKEYLKQLAKAKGTSPDSFLAPLNDGMRAGLKEKEAPPSPFAGMEAGEIGIYLGEQGFARWSDVTEPHRTEVVVRLMEIMTESGKDKKQLLNTVDDWMEDGYVRYRNKQAEEAIKQELVGKTAYRGGLLFGKKGVLKIADIARVVSREAHKAYRAWLGSLQGEGGANRREFERGLKDGYRQNAIENWVHVYTNAPGSYDGFSAMTIVPAEDVIWGGRKETLRHVVVKEEDFEWLVRRYGGYLALTKEDLEKSNKPPEPPEPPKPAPEYRIDKLPKNTKIVGTSYERDLKFDVWDGYVAIVDTLSYYDRKQTYIPYGGTKLVQIVPPAGGKLSKTKVYEQYHVIFILNRAGNRIKASEPTQKTRDWKGDPATYYVHVPTNKLYGISAYALENYLKNAGYVNVTDDTRGVTKKSWATLLSLPSWDAAYEEMGYDLVNKANNALRYAGEEYDEDDGLAKVPGIFCTTKKEGLDHKIRFIVDGSN